MISPFLLTQLFSYFERDVECVRRFFRKRFRYHSDEFPRFQDVVPEYARKQTKPKPTTDVGEAVDEAGSVAAEAGDVRLDLLAKASGFGGSKQDRELEQVSCAAAVAMIGGVFFFFFFFFFKGIKADR